MNCSVNPCFNVGLCVQFFVDAITTKQEEIDTCKHELHSFQSAFVPPRHQNFSQKHIDKLKTKAAEFLTLKFELVYNNPNMAVQQP